MATRIAANPRALIATAASQLGVSEEPPRSNCQRFGAWYPMNCVAWCAIFVSWVFARSGYRQAIRTLNGASYVPDWVNYAKATGQWRPVGTYTPRAGDIVIFWFTNRPDHIGLVVRPIDGGVETLEGNTSSGGSRTGGSVLRLNRRSRIHGYIAVDYVDYIPEPPADGGGSSVPVNPAPTASQEDEHMELIRNNIPGHAAYGEVWEICGKDRLRVTDPDQLNRLRFYGGLSGGSYVEVTNPDLWTDLMTRYTGPAEALAGLSAIADLVAERTVTRMRS